MNSNEVISLSHSQSNSAKEFADSLSTEVLNKIDALKVRSRIFDPLKTIQLFLREVTENISLKSVLINFNIDRSKLKEKLVSNNTGAYSRSKKLLPENLLKDLCLTQKVDDSDEFLWKKRNVKIVDGTTIQMADTPENQKEYPQSCRQKVGLGQPLMRCLGIFSYATGALTDIEIAAYSGKGTAEPSLLRRLLSRFAKSDILLMDRFFTSYFLHIDLNEKNIDFLVRIKESAGKKLFKKNEKDKTLIQKRPMRPGHLPAEEYYYYDKKYEFRYIKYISKKNGHRDKVYYFKTSLLNKSLYSYKDICFLYSQRWDVEINIRNLKRTLDTYFLKSKSPEMVRKELYMKILAYNLVRKLIVIFTGHLPPRQFSFKIALFYLKNILAGNYKPAIKVMEKLLKKEVLIDRGRSEPRLLKARNRGTFGLLTISRDVYKSLMLVA